MVRSVLETPSVRGSVALTWNPPEGKDPRVSPPNVKRPPEIG
jgi:hypothetical protein